MEKLKLFGIIHIFVLFMVVVWKQNTNETRLLAQYEQWSKSRWLRWTIRGETFDEYVINQRQSLLLILPVFACFYLFLMWACFFASKPTKPIYDTSNCQCTIPATPSKTGVKR